MDRKSQIYTFSSYTRVSRETINSLEIFEKMLIEENKKLNLIGKSTEKDIWKRHFLDSYQVLDFIEENDKIVMDLGSGAGFPGIIVALGIKDKKMPVKVNLLEKSRKKSSFLKRAIHKLKINVEVINENAAEEGFKLKENVFMARAFKPLEEILKLIHKKAENWKKILIFQGKNGSKELLRSSKTWDIKYKHRQSITNNDSLILEIKGLKKKIE
jgi:16S rRNA (guanine527-N7)-methyltransferase